MTGATLFSGIGAPEVAMPWVDWQWCAEIEKFPSAVIAERHPGIPNLGDVTAGDFIERAKQHGSVDLLIFGSPCQSFSVAGKRLGLDDPRGNLALVALGIVAALAPRWFVFENVPGLFSSWSGQPEGEPDEGQVWGFIESSDFAAFLEDVQSIGYCGAWSVLDAQYFHLAQRRERLFFVGHSGDWRYPAAVLLEPESLSGHLAPSREAGQGITHDALQGTVGSLCARDSKTVSNQFVNEGKVIPILEAGARCGEADEREGLGVGKQGEPMFTLQGGHQHAVAYGGNNTTACNAHAGPHGRLDFETETFVAHALRADGFDASEDGTGRGTPLVTTLAIRGRGESSNLETRTDGTANAILTPNGGRAGVGIGAVQHGMAVRRFTPRECERLQGFPDDYTLVTYRGKPAKDGPRYKALGNAMAVPVVRWIGDRIRQVEGTRMKNA